MPRDLRSDDVLEPRPTPTRMVWRGFRKRCARCGGRGLYQGWFRMRERCPSCGMRFEREPGFFVGAYLINFAITEGFLFLIVMGWVVAAFNRPGAGLAGPMVVGVAVAVVAPILFYPYARTIWSAIDLAMRPLELDEIVAAQEWREGQGRRDGPGRPLP